MQHEIEILDNTEGLSPVNALKILKRVIGLADLFILANTSSFAELEQEKNMPTGGILRQCLRLSRSTPSLLCERNGERVFCLAMTSAVRHCMECRYQRFDSTSAASKPSPPSAATSVTKGPSKDPIEIILELTYLMNSSNEIDIDSTIENLLSSIIKNPESILQELDIQRLRAMIYRDVVRQDRNKAGKNVVIVVVNLTQYFSSFFAQLYFMSSSSEIHSTHVLFVSFSLGR